MENENYTKEKQKGPKRGHGFFEVHQRYRCNYVRSTTKPCYSCSDDERCVLQMATLDLQSRHPRPQNIKSLHAHVARRYSIQGITGSSVIYSSSFEIKWVYSETSYLVVMLAGGGGRIKTSTWFVCGWTLLPVMISHTQWLMVSGHSYLPNNRNFGGVESARRRQPQIFIPEDWYRLVERPDIECNQQQKSWGLKTASFHPFITHLLFSVDHWGWFGYYISWFCSYHLLERR